VGHRFTSRSGACGLVLHARKDTHLASRFVLVRFRRLTLGIGLTAAAGFSYAGLRRQTPRRSQAVIPRVIINTASTALILTPSHNAPFSEGLEAAPAHSQDRSSGAAERTRRLLSPWAGTHITAPGSPLGGFFLTVFRQLAADPFTSAHVGRLATRVRPRDRREGAAPSSRRVSEFSVHGPFNLSLRRFVWGASR
jgi:hypothetical protein